MGSLVHDEKYGRFLRSLRREELIKWKQSENVFFIPHDNGESSSLIVETEEIVSQVQKLEINGSISYEMLIAKMQALVRKLVHQDKSKNYSYGNQFIFSQFFLSLLDVLMANIFNVFTVPGAARSQRSAPRCF